jgi:hypothetical protein
MPCVMRSVLGVRLSASNPVRGWSQVVRTDSQTDLECLDSLAMTIVLKPLWPTGVAILAVSVSSIASAQTAPSGAHPRIWLDAATQSGMRAQASDANSPVKRAALRCAAAHSTPSEYAVGGWQGFEFVTTLSSCLAAYVASGSADDLATAVKYWNALLDDYQTVGDGLGGDDVVTHDTGYAMRTFAPYSALAYDWLHDAPGVTEALRAHARARFDAWSTYYSTSGYLRHLAGANYQAGYAFAATLMAIAEAGEAGAAGDAHWANVRDVIWKQDLEPAFGPGGVLDGGDWAEGWQYGALSVLEHALAARAMQENGSSISGVAAWSSSLPLRFAHGLTPGSRQSFTGGDSDATTPYREPNNGALLAAIAGPASDQAKALARKLNTDLQLSNENPLFDALAAATPGATTALPDDSSTNYLARGSGNWYVRGAWTADTAWSVLQCTHHLVDDHQYVNAGNWVLTRGADDLVVDPSPYGSLSTLTGNAPAVDSASLPSGYSPSQGYWGKTTGWVWTRQAESGVAAGRCSYADQFQRSDVASDVSQALRDFVLIPQGNGAAIVLIDRVLTGSADRGLHLRVRTPAALALTPDGASATLAGSSLAIRKVWSSSGTPSVRDMPRASECPSSSHTCDVSKLPSGSEYRVDVAGPSAFAIHVVNAQAGAAAPAGTLLSGSGYRGVLVAHAGSSVAVLTNDTTAGTAGDALVYRVPVQAGAIHVVLDAPADADGLSDVTAVLAGKDCEVTVKQHVGAQPGVSARPLVLNVAGDCALKDDGTQKPAEPETTPTGDAGFGSGGTAASAAGSDGGGAGAAHATGGASSPAAGQASDPSGGVAAIAGASSDSGCAFAPQRNGTDNAAAVASGALGLWLFGRRRRTQRRAHGMGR